MIDQHLKFKNLEPCYTPCLRSYMVSSSSLPKKVMAIPVFPARPVRPIRCTYFSMVDAICQLMTQVTSGTSIPRPAYEGVTIRLSAA